jgi:hypothetical protein
MRRIIVAAVAMAAVVLVSENCQAGGLRDARLRQLLALSQGYGGALDLPGDCSSDAILGTAPLSVDLLAYRQAVSRRSSLAALREAQHRRELQKLARLRRELLRQQLLDRRGLRSVIGLRIGY